MSSVFFIMMLIAMLLTVGSLALGIGVMVKGGEVNKKYGNKLMRLRVIMQGIAILFFALAFLTAE